MKLKITKTLIESWAYTFNAAEGYEEEAMADFLHTLNREPVEESEAIQCGKAFEDLCYRMAEGQNVVRETPTGGALPTTEMIDGEAIFEKEYPKWYDGAKKISEIITGGQIQVPISCDLQVAGQEFWLYGITDCIKAGVIYDIKFRMKSLGADDVYGKYLDCSQHPLYLKALPEASKFIYLVSDGQDLYTETYTRDESKPIEDHILNFWAWMNTKPELLRTYREKWVVE